MSNPISKIELDGRGPMEWIAFVASIVALGLSLLSSAPWWFNLFPLGLTLSIGLAMLSNIPRGMELSDEAFVMHKGHWRKTIALADIAQLVVTNWSDSTDTELILRDGTVVSIPSYCFRGSPELVKLFSQRGIETVMK